MAKPLPSTPDDQPASKGPSKFVLLALVGGLTLFAGAAGGGLGMMLPAGAPGASQEAEGKAEPVASEAPYAGRRIQPLPDIVTNLATPSDSWVRLEAAIVLEGEADKEDEVLASEIAGDVVAFLRTVSLAQLEGPSGLLHLRDDLAERARLRSEGRVGEVIIQSMVVE